MLSITSPIKYAGTATDSSGTPSAWASINNSKVLDAAVATFADGTGVAWSHGGGAGLALTNYGFSIPSNAVIDGIQLVVTHSGYLVVPSVGLLNVTGAVGKGMNVNPALTNYTVGGPTDTWGATITPAMLNSSSFGVNLSGYNTHDPADASYSVDAVSIVIYYHIGLVATPNDVPIREIYKVFNAQGKYLGNMPKVTTPLKLGQDVNSLGSQITIQVGVSPDTAKEATEIYTTEDGTANYTTEDGTGNYTTEGQIPIVSAAYQGIDALIKNGNIVECWLYNYWYPNGKCMYVGKIRRWEADFGGGGDAINVKLYSTSYEMDNYVVRGAPFAYTNDQSNTVQNGYISTFTNGGDKGGGWYVLGQTFTAGATNEGAVSLLLNGTADVTVNLYTLPNGGTLLGSVTVSVNTGGIPTVVQFGFPSLLTSVPGTSYFFDVRPAPGQGIDVYYQNTDVYAGGSAWLSSYGGGGGGSFGPITGDLYFVTGSGTPSTVATFNSKDPSTGMLAPILTDYALRGGSYGWTVATIDATGLSLSYTFSVQTVYEALQAILSMSPNGFYYYVDLGNQIIYFKNQSTSADFLLQKGVHINALTLINTTEGSINQVLFTGGEVTPGVNLYKQYLSNQSIAAFGPLLDRKTDNRVTLDATANAVGLSEIAELSGEQYQTTITIPHTKKLDITMLVPGKVVGFRGYGTFVDTILAQIVHRDWQAEATVLTVGVLPTRLLTEYEQTTRELTAAQTQNNPSTPT